ncbi:sulfotransferase [Pelagibius sp.]|uniref:sulfotransferase family protein n=1 Tax=Pelagibius sp. TaxID=1931238 RepID=UPI00263658B8|nr:sulfotransferase [Pelagibius sp.]
MSDRDLPLHVHVGMPKTATSTLQQLYFAEHPEIDYLALRRKGGRYGPESQFGAFVRWLREDPDLWTERRRYRSFLRNELCSGRPGTRCRLLSEERFTGHFGAGIPAKAELMRDFFPEAHIIVTVRRPLDLLASNYAQHLRHPRPGAAPLPSFDRWVEETLAEPNDASSYAHTVRLYDTVRLFDRLFGREKVLVLVFEEFRDNPAAFLRQLAGWLSIDTGPFEQVLCSRHQAVNPSPTRLQLNLWRLRQRWVNRGTNSLGVTLTWAATVAAHVTWPAKAPPAADTRARVAQFTGEQCARLSADRGLDLWRYGYPGVPRSTTDRGDMAACRRLVTRGRHG